MLSRAFGKRSNPLRKWKRSLALRRRRSQEGTEVLGNSLAGKPVGPFSLSKVDINVALGICRNHPRLRQMGQPQ